MDPLLAGRIWLFTRRATSTVVCISVYIGVLLYRWVLGSRCHTSPTRPITLYDLYKESLLYRPKLIYSTDQKYYIC